MDLLLSEVNEELRRDRLFALWGRWRKHVYYIALALVLGTAASSIWGHVRESHAQKAMDVFTQGREAFAKGDYDNADRFFGELATLSRGDLHDLAVLWQARSFAEQQKKKEAATALAALARHPNGDDLIWRDLACLRLAGLDAAALPEVCASTEDSPLRAQRLELHAAQLFAQGKHNEARALLTTAAEDEAASTTARARAGALRAALGEEEGE